MDHIRVLLAENHTLVRAGIRALLDRIEGVDVVAEAGNRLENLGQIEQTKPDIVLMGIFRPDANGLEALSRLGKRFPEIGVIVIAMHEGPGYVLQAIRLGAKSYLTMAASPKELELAIMAVAHGGTYFSLEHSKKTHPEVVSKSGEKSDAPAHLTARQYEVLCMIAESYSTKGIALRLNISVKTVESHRTQLMERLNIHDVAGLVRYAVRNGLVKLD